MVSQDDFTSRASALVRSEDELTPFVPLDAQQRLASMLLAHQRVIALQPTGSGKTLGAALPFATGLLTPGQLCYMTPLRTLTSAQAQVLSGRIRPEVASANLGVPWTVAQQTGTAPDDPDFLATVNVATFDQAISAALRISYGASMRRRTVNAGAVLTSYLVADEVHLFPRDEALTTLLCLLKHRPPELPFLLMTATLTPRIAEGLADLLGAALLDEPVSPADRQRLRVAQRTRRVHWQPAPFSPRQIVEAGEEAAGRSVLVVVNTVRRAIELAQALEPLIGRDRLRILHGRFYQADRNDHERAILTAFGKSPPTATAAFGRDGGVVIATQVVEVGLDLSADVLFTELAPASALVQRWGRCARWGGQGHVIVAPPDGKSGQVYPYVGQDDGVVVEQTHAWLEAYASTGDGIVMEDATERALLTAGHAEADDRWLSMLTSALTQRTTKVGETIAHGRYELAGELIRQVDTRTVLICGGDLTTRLAEPLAMQGFSLAPGSLMPLVRDAAAPGRAALSVDRVDDDDEGEGLISFDLAPDIPWKLKRPVWPEQDADSEWNANAVSGWVEVATRAEITRSPVLAINPAIVAYEPFFGLSLTPSAQPVAEQYWAMRAQRPQQPARPWTPRQRETLETHVATMLRLYEQHPVLGSRLQRVAVLIEGWCGWPEGTLDRLVRATIVAHDVGKLTPAWQRGIKRYQQAIGKPGEDWLVHTDDAGGKQIAFPRPPHALSGAAHSQVIGEALDATVEAAALGESMGALPSNILFSAIATHHAPSLKTYLLSRDEFLDRAAVGEMRRLLSMNNLPDEAVVLRLENYVGCGVEQHDLTAESAEREGFILALVTRMLRLADGWSQDPARLAEVQAAALSRTRGRDTSRHREEQP